MTQKDLYPMHEPWDRFALPVSSLHTLHVEQGGKADGVPVVFLHGGPGDIWSPAIYRFFDPDHYRVIAFDQRGVNRSTPAGELTDNTTPHLIADIEAIREHLDIERWIVFGGSWGSALALAYALEHRDRVLALVVRGIYMGDSDDDIWGFSHCRNLLPEAWDELASHFSDSDHDNLFAACARDINDDDEVRALEVAKAFDDFSGLLCGNTTKRDDIPLHKSSDAETLVTSRLSLAYFANDIFLPPMHLPNNVHKLAGLPGAIVQGRRDLICPARNAWMLHKAWPDASLTISDDAGHAPFEDGNREALVAAMETLKDLRS
ncbi:MAG: prolyl aminopeptidase [Pseudomonadota bacterium]